MEQVGLAAAASEVSLWSLFMQAGLVVKLVMVGLIGASVWTWAIVIDKYISFGKAKRQFDQFEQVFWSGQSLEELYRTLSERTNTGLAAIFVAAMREWKKSFERGARSPIGLQMRIDRAMDVTMSREAETYEARLGSLATIGSAGPFIGLFGTVVGIMTSFQAIAGSKSTNLAVVAPGIAEALLATAIGLVAAIPAVIAYNKFTADAGKLSGRMEGFADEFPPSCRARSTRSCSRARRRSNSLSGSRSNVSWVCRPEEQNRVAVVAGAADVAAVRSAKST